MESLLPGARCFFLGVVAWSAFLPALVSADNDAAWASLSRQVEARRIELAALIREAESKGINTDYASVSQQVIAAFQLAAQHDRDHVEEVRRIFNTFAWRKKIDPAAADKLAPNELKACLEVADHAMVELRQQLNGKMTLSDAPDFSKGKMELGAGAYRLDGRPVFPSSLVWLPNEEGLMQALGRLGGGFYQLTHLKADGTVQPWMLKRAVESTEKQVALNGAPLVYLMGHAPAPWMTQQHPEITQGARNFTKYDIDSPLIRDWIKLLCAGVLPDVSKACGDQPQLHLLANEPHFATQRGGWLAKNGVSELTMRKYRQWVAAKYETIAAVNQVYGTSYEDFDHVNIQLPIDPALRGTAAWYDWCRFNMDRVNDWFSFLKQQVQTHDPNQSPVTIKLLGHTLGTPLRDHGMDIEFLTKLQDVNGADLRVIPQGATFYGKNEDGLASETGWGHRYAYLWVDQSMMLDFTKSLCPDKVFYDSEWHGFGTVSWRHYDLNRDYVRSALWLAFSHGMAAINPWLWGRDLDGALSDQADHIGELATQPIAVDAYGRTIKELNAHADRVLSAVPRTRHFVIFYCEEAAIQSEDYIKHLEEVYEALKLLNVSVGFTTPSEIGNLNSKTQTLIVPPTQFISDKSLSKIDRFQQAAGRVVLVGAEQNFLKNELGVKRSGDAAVSAFASIPMDGVLQMAAALDAGLAPVKPRLPLDVVITDPVGAKAYGVIMSQSIHPKTGVWSLLLNNVSKDRRVVNLKFREGQHGRFMDVMTRQAEQTRFVMEPCDVRLLTNVK